MATNDDYGLSKIPLMERRDAPALPYHPPTPRDALHAIGVIGCGGISAQHLAAYRHAGFNVVALCDRNIVKAQHRRQQYFPQARVTTDYRKILDDPKITVVDITTHPADRVRIMRDAIDAGKHILSQKPFVTDLGIGEELIACAEKRGVRIAVNQNGRWAPHLSYLREAIKAELIGEIKSVNFTLHWDHSWIIGTPYEHIHELILYDFGIHWFDLAACFFAPREATQVFAVTAAGTGQKAQPPLLANVILRFDGGLATLNFNADVTYGQEDRTYIAGTRGSLTSVGPSLSEQSVALYTEAGCAVPQLTGTWFLQGFEGTMADLLCAIEENREPLNNARDNLRGLALCFAAIASAAHAMPYIPGTVRTIPFDKSNRTA